jgi:hypothetical protein
MLLGPTFQYNGHYVSPKIKETLHNCLCPLLVIITRMSLLKPYAKTKSFQIICFNFFIYDLMFGLT